MGKECNGLDWEVISDENENEDTNEDSNEDEASELPWDRVMAGEKPHSGSRIKLTTALNVNYTFSVNVSPITATAEVIKGALITFDDITELETKNEELNRAFDKLKENQQEMMQQNQELLLLATRDPLTDVLNRRSLFEGFDIMMAETIEEGGHLSCIMVDIDHFKLVNDNHGHAVGDTVIKLLANILTQYSRRNDLVGRFGGEEFVIVLPLGDITVAASIAERIRQVVEAGDSEKFPDFPSITSSFGVATLTGDIDNAQDLLERADEALYQAKANGRNRVICWSTSMLEEAQEQSGTASLNSDAISQTPSDYGETYHRRENDAMGSLSDLSEKAHVEPLSPASPAI
ncbi:MAG: GGDEF domain-containing protein, partial [Pseudomonadales bacterium]|nr:GGDEF domain-containing protein [Pseudomonadales bacterium]